MKIKFAPFQPHCFAFGGFEIQMLAAFDSIQKKGCDVSKLNPWERDNRFDVLHCWGLGTPHLESINWAKRSGKKIVVTALLPYNEFLSEKIRHFISSKIRTNYFLIKTGKLIDQVIVVNDLQAEACHRDFKISEKKIEIVPNIVNDRFFSIASDSGLKKIVKDKYNLQDYVLTTGNICKRKNQVNLIKACLEERIKLVLIGKILPDEPEEYIQEFIQLIKVNPTITWIDGLAENSDELISFYANCSLFALPSHIETQPISLLEAGVLGKPLLIADRAYSRQSYYTHACLINPDSIHSIRAGLMNITRHPTNYVPPPELFSECKEGLVGSKYVDIYKKLIEV